ncbi:MAG TPA: FxsA family protein [Nitrospiria bacterium]
MLFKLILLFLAVPLVEIYFLIKVGEIFGAFHTVFFVILTAIIGAFFARLEGLRTLGKMQIQLQNGQMPAEEIIDSLLIFMASVLLLTPGFLTDAIGFLILFPVTRVFIKRWLRRQFDYYLNKRAIDIHFKP